MAKTWDPSPRRDLPADAAEDRHRVNEERARIIEVLRREFGPRFYGGFMHSEYAAKQYSGLLVEHPELTEQSRYLWHMKRFPICIATTGLHHSIGWHFAEYVAFSKAIVSEALHYQLPGNFSESVNFVAFRTPQECVEAAAKLCEDESLRRRMMVANFCYFHRYVRPDALILNSLKRALELAGQR